MTDLLGWAAALLTLATFACRETRSLRVMALAANATFISYGALAGLMPVLALHAALVPVNLWRLREAVRMNADAAPDKRASAVGSTGGRLCRGATRSLRLPLQ